MYTTDLAREVCLQGVWKNISAGLLPSFSVSQLETFGYSKRWKGDGANHGVPPSCPASPVYIRYRKAPGLNLTKREKRRQRERVREREGGRE